MVLNASQNRFVSLMSGGQGRDSLPVIRPESSVNSLQPHIRMADANARYTDQTASWELAIRTPAKPKAQKTVINNSLEWICRSSACASQSTAPVDTHHTNTTKITGAMIDDTRLSFLPDRLQSACFGYLVFLYRHHVQFHKCCSCRDTQKGFLYLAPDTASFLRFVHCN